MNYYCRKHNFEAICSMILLHFSSLNWALTGVQGVNIKALACAVIEKYTKGH